jgi:hypothetical protein
MGHVGWQKGRYRDMWLLPALIRDVDGKEKPLPKERPN